MRQRVVGDRNVRPQGAKELFLADQDGRACRQVEQQIDGFGGDRDGDAVPHQSKGTGVEREAPEGVRPRGCRVHSRIVTRSAVTCGS